MATRIPVLAFVVLFACDDAPPPASCSSWLDCYERCDPMQFVGDGDPAFGLESVRFCEADCASSSSSSSSSSSAVVAADLVLADVEAPDEERVAAAIEALRARAACLLAVE